MKSKNESPVSWASKEEAYEALFDYLISQVELEPLKKAILCEQFNICLDFIRHCTQEPAMP